MIQTQLALLRRELWEHRSVFVVPGVVALITLLTSWTSQVTIGELEHLDIGIVGGGIVGVSTALWLIRDGHRVTLFDRTDPGSADQTSFGNAGMIASCGIVPVNAPGSANTAILRPAKKSPVEIISGPSGVTFFMVISGIRSPTLRAITLLLHVIGCPVIRKGWRHKSTCARTIPVAKSALFDKRTKLS